MSQGVGLSGVSVARVLHLLERFIHCGGTATHCALSRMCIHCLRTLSPHLDKSVVFPSIMEVIDSKSASACLGVFPPADRLRRNWWIGTAGEQLPVQRLTPRHGVDTLLWGIFIS